MNKKANILSFNPKQLNKKLLEVLPTRAAEILTFRYGLGDDTKKQTLEAIGDKYGITRERIRQIENYSIKTIKKSDVYEKEKAPYAELRVVLKTLGGTVKENELLEHFSSDKSTQNHINFMLTVSEDFRREKEDDDFHHRWHIDEKLAEKIHEALKNLYNSLSNDEIIPEAEMVKSFLKHLKDVSEEYKNDEMIKRWLNISKKIGKNPLGEWGKANSTNVKVKGVRDYAYLIIRKHGSPIHFREVANLIEKTFNKRAHFATTHNELIKDARFVLVGRGLYALSEWGYEKGVVKDVIASILKKEGPLAKDEIIKKVLKERYVKENTVLVNLQNPKFFKKNKEGKYTLI